MLQCHNQSLQSMWTEKIILHFWRLQHKLEVFVWHVWVINGFERVLFGNKRCNPINYFWFINFNTFLGNKSLFHSTIWLGGMVQIYITIENAIWSKTISLWWLPDIMENRYLLKLSNTFGFWCQLAATMWYYWKDVYIQSRVVQQT